VVRSSADDKVSIITAGITVHEAMKAAEALASEGIGVRIVDAYSVKPMDKAGIHEAARATGGRVLTVEDHWPEGGLGEAVLDALTDFGAVTHVVKIAVTKMPGSAKPDECLAVAGLDAAHIAAAVRTLAS